MSAIVFAAALVYLELSVLPGLRMCVVEQAGVTAGAGALASQALKCIPPSASGVLVVALVGLISFVALGWRERFATLWSALERRNLTWMPPLAVVALVALPYLARGDVMLRDASLFKSMTVHLADVIHQGGNPYYSFYWFLGCSPYTQYGWLYWLVSGELGRLFGSELIDKLLPFALHVGSAAGAFAFSRAATRDTRIAAVAALGYGLSFDHFGRVFSGRTQLSLLYFLIPLLFWVWELRSQNRLAARVAIALVGVLSCLLIFIHQVDGAFAVGDFSVYALVSAFDAKTLRRVTRELAAGLGLGALLSSFWTIPMVLEVAEVSASKKAEAVLIPSLPKLEMLWAVVPGPFRDIPIHYVGLCVVVLAVFGLRAELRRQHHALAALCGLSLAAALFQSPRHLPVLLFGLATSAGLGLRAVGEAYGARGSRLALLLVCLDSVPLTAQLGYPDFSYLRSFYKNVEAHDGERVVDLTSDRRTFWPTFIYLFGKNETVFGTIIECAPRGLAMWVAMGERAAEEHYDRAEAFSKSTLDAFYLLGVKSVILHTEQVGKDPLAIAKGKRGGLGLERGLELFEMPEHSLLVAAPSLVPVPVPELQSKEGWELRSAYEKRQVPYGEVGALLERMGLDRSTATAAAIPVLDAPAESLPDQARVEVKRVQTGPNHVTLDYVSSATFLELSYSHSPHLVVRIDGVAVPFHRTALGTVAVRTAAGAHRLELEAEPSKLRRFMPIASALGLLLALGLALWPRNAREPS